MSEFPLRLPIVRSKASPWYTYLTHVYSSDVPLPFDVAQLELFYPAMLPTSMCGQSMPVRPRCNAGECRSWVNHSRHPSADDAFGVRTTPRRGPAGASTLIHRRALHRTR